MLRKNKVGGNNKGNNKIIAEDFFFWSLVSLCFVWFGLFFVFFVLFLMPYLLPIGCLQRVARVGEDHPGGYGDVFSLSLPEKETAQRRATSRGIGAGWRSLRDSQWGPQNIRMPSRAASPSQSLALA